VCFSAFEDARQTGGGECVTHPGVGHLRGPLRSCALGPDPDSGRDVAGALCAGACAYVGNDVYSPGSSPALREVDADLVSSWVLGGEWVTNL